MVKRMNVTKSIAGIIMTLAILISSQASANNWSFFSILAEKYLEAPKVQLELGQYYLQRNDFNRARDYFWKACDLGVRQRCDEYSRAKKLSQKYAYSDHHRYKDDRRYFKSEKDRQKEWKKEQKNRKKYEKERRKEAKRREKEDKRFRKDLHKMIDDGLDGKIKVDKVIKNVLERM